MEHTYSAAYNRGGGSRRGNLGLLLLLAIGAIPGMAILSAVADVFSLSMAPKQMWLISSGVSLVLFLFMCWRAYTFREASRAFLSLSGIIAIVFLVMHFGLQTASAARWTERFVLEQGSKASPPKGFIARAPAEAVGDKGLAAALQATSTPADLNSLPVRRAVAVADEVPTMSIPALAPVPIPALLPPGVQPKYSIVGIPPNDMLNVRAGPGSNFPKVQELRPGYDKIAAVGKPQMNGDTEWVLITFENQSGWVAGQYIRTEP